MVNRLDTSRDIPYNIPHSEIPRQQHHVAADRERSEKVQDLFRKLGNTPLYFQPVGKEPSPSPHDDKTTTPIEDNETDTDNEDDKSSLGRLSDDDNDMSPAEDEEDDKMDDKVWRVIMHQSDNNDCCVLDSFKFYFRLSQALDHDPTVENIMDSVRTVRDENGHVGFKKSSDQTLSKRKFLIKRALKREEADNDAETYDMNIWKLLLAESAEDGKDVFKQLRLYILFCRSFKRDAIFRSVMELMQESMEGLDPMDSEEALDYAVDRKSSTIEAAAAHQCGDQVGSGMYLKPYPHKGRGIQETCCSSSDEHIDSKI